MDTHLQRFGGQIHGKNLDEVSHQYKWVDIYLNSQGGWVYSNLYIYCHLEIKEQRSVFNRDSKRSEPNYMQKARFRDGSADVGWYDCDGVT